MAKRTVITAVLVMLLAAAMVGGATMAWFTDSATAEAVEFTAGTLMVEAGTSMVFGVERVTGDLYEIDVSTGKNELLFDGTTTHSDANYPNGLAYDRQMHRLYYSYSDGRLFFYDFDGNETQAGRLKNQQNGNQMVAGATFGQGYYWYVPNNTADLYRVSFDVDGLVLENELVKDSFTTGSFGFGDLAMDIKDGIIYGSSVDGRFFTIDMRDDYAYQQIGSRIRLNGSNVGLQLAFGADGNLYGHATHVDGPNWFMVDVTNATLTTLEWSPGYYHFTDLASNFQNNWNPGDCDKVKYFFDNVSTKAMVLRFTPELLWEVSENNEFWDGSTLNLDNITLALCDEADANWKKVDEYFYYVGPSLEAGERTELCLKVCLDGPLTDNMFQGATLTLDGTVEAVQASNGAPNAQWNVSLYDE